MSGYSMGLTMENIRLITTMVMDIFIMSLVLYYSIRLVRNNSRTIQIFKGILLVIFIDLIAKLFGLNTVAYITDIFINWGFLAIIIIFQPEIRSILERLGKSNVFSRITTLTGNEKEQLVDQIVTATMLLSQDMTGALISIEQSHSLEDYISTGTRLNSDVTAELLTSLFVTTTPLHDGAVIIQGDKIACASAYFPPTNLELPSRFGARHRAAIGISEITDAVTIVVSEETGAISIAEAGKIYQVNRKELRDYLLRVILGEETEVRAQTPIQPGREILIHDGEDLPEEKEEPSTLRDKLAVKKQDTEEVEKIEVEEVVSAEEVIEEEPEEVIVEEPEKKKSSLSLFGNRRQRQSDEDTAIIKLEEEAQDIKLPRNKKATANPSYPSQEVEEVVETKEVVEEPAQPEVENARMTSEDVEKMRKQFIEQYSATPKEKTHTTPSPSAGSSYLTDNERQFDTTKLDLSKIVGEVDDLGEMFEIVDQMPNDSSSDQGGEH